MLFQSDGSHDLTYHNSSQTRNPMERQITQIICANNGSMDLDELVVNVTSSTLQEHHMTEVLSNRDRFLRAVLNGREKVISKTPMRVCKTRGCSGGSAWGGPGGGCSDLHLCKKFLLGNCPFAQQGRRPCRFGHDLSTFQNACVLQGHGLSDLTMSQLRSLLLQNDQSLLPPICFDYNNERCQAGENCTRLHICQRFLKTTCSCPKAHDFNKPQPLKTLQARGVSGQLLSSLKTVYMNKQTLNDQERHNNPSQRQQQPPSRADSVDDLFAAALGVMAPVSDVPGQPANRNRRPRGTARKHSQPTMKDKTEICMYFIKGHCKHADKCFKAHSKLPYRWEVRDGRQWTALPNQEEVEKNYADPNNTGCFDNSGCVQQPVCFDTMTRGPNAVRRLSTVSSVLEPSFVLTTDWAWFWEDEVGAWHRYAAATGGHRAAAVSSAELEQKFQNDEKTEVEFTAGSQTYTLSFQDMIQTNQRYGTKRLVRRRPVFVSAHEAQVMKTSRRNPSNFTALPGHWDKSQTPQTGFTRVALATASAEYREIESLFGNTMTGVDVLHIQRIQNKDLWEAFQLQKDVMKRNNGGQNVAERKLFHGTDPQYADTICRHNFDWRICGTHGTAYGKGSYFARDAKYSHSYTGQSDVRSMFVCRVLVGDYTVGSPDYVRPPSKDGGDSVFYNSCVNRGDDPSIFVVFDKPQIYPEYLVQYQMKTAASFNSYFSTPATSSVSVQYSTPAPRPAAAPAAVLTPVAVAATLRPTPVASAATLRPAAAPATLRPTPVAAAAPATLRPTPVAAAAPATLRPTPVAAAAPATLRPTPVAAATPATLRPTPVAAPATLRPTPAPAAATLRAAAATHDTAALLQALYSTPVPRPMPGTLLTPTPAPRVRATPAAPATVKGPAPSAPAAAAAAAAMHRAAMHHALHPLHPQYSAPSRPAPPSTPAAPSLVLTSPHRSPFTVPSPPAVPAAPRYVLTSTPPSPSSSSSRQKTKKDCVVC